MYSLATPTTVAGNAVNDITTDCIYCILDPVASLVTGNRYRFACPSCWFFTFLKLLAGISLQSSRNKRPVLRVARVRVMESHGMTGWNSQCKTTSGAPSPSLGQFLVTPLISVYMYAAQYFGACTSTMLSIVLLNNRLISRWDSESELFNDDIVHVLQNTVDSRINSVIGRRSLSQPEAKHQNKESNGKVKLKR